LDVTVPHIKSYSCKSVTSYEVLFLYVASCCATLQYIYTTNKSIPSEVVVGQILRVTEIRCWMFTDHKLCELISRLEHSHKSLSHLAQATMVFSFSFAKSNLMVWMWTFDESARNVRVTTWDSFQHRVVSDLIVCRLVDSTGSLGLSSPSGWEEHPLLPGQTQKFAKPSERIALYYRSASVPT
jgi:hypothetical protein